MYWSRAGNGKWNDNLYGLQSLYLYLDLTNQRNGVNLGSQVIFLFVL